MDKESELTKLNGESEERSPLANAQEIEVIALKTQVEALKKALDGVSAESRAIEDYRTAERIELKSANEELIKERGEFEAFRRRVAELVQQLMAQTAEDKIRAGSGKPPGRAVSGCLTKAQSSSSICAARSRSRARQKPICAEVPSRSRAVPIPPSRT